MHLNTLKPAKGAKRAPKRVGRGMGSGLGKTCGRGHKGQRARSGGYHKVGFEGGQMPLQRRVPKFGFNAGVKKPVELRLHDLAKINAETIDMLALKTEGLIAKSVTRVKIILSGKIEKAVIIKGIPTTAGAKRAVEAVGGQVQA